MRGLWLMVAVAVVGWLCAGCTASGGSLPYDPANPPAQTTAYMLPDQFAHTQGYKGWYYYQAVPDSTSWQTLAWGAAPAEAGHGLTECWRDATNPAVLIGAQKAHPAGGADAVIAWRASKAGLATVTATLQGLATDPAGDGVAASFWLNTTRVSEPSILPNQTQSQTITCQRTVAANDTLALRLNARTDASADWFAYSFTIQIK